MQRIFKFKICNKWCPDLEPNHRHEGLQSLHERVQKLKDMDDPVIKAIKEAFGSVSFPNHMGLRAAKAVDGWISDKDVLARITREEDIIADWWDIPNAELDQCTLGLSYLDSEGIDFYLPAYMCRHVKTPTKGKFPFVIMIMDPNIIWSEPPLRELFESRFSKINSAKKLACRLFLERMKERYSESVTGRIGQIDGVLEHSFWQID